MTSRRRRIRCQCALAKHQTGLTILELLVVIAVIAVLTALLMPAVQQAREAASRIRCADNLRQIAIALHSFHDTHNSLPSGGWGWTWAPHPDRGAGVRQPGGWGYVLLPFLEQSALYGLGLGSVGAELEAANATRLKTAIPVWYCPSRRDVRAYPVGNSIPEVLQPKLSARLTQSARTDYAINGGESFLGFGRGPATLEDGDSGNYRFPDGTSASGMVHVRSRVTFATVSDGLSNTYLAGEKYVSRASAQSGAELGDDQGPYLSDDRDSIRWATFGGAYLQPSVDGPGPDRTADTFRFGSAHSAAFGVALTDGSVRWMQYTLDEQIHRHLANRHDGTATNPAD
ncbi:MAG: DUF1559 domain-containing protein [Planctomycetota bacterium]